jgi:hypothetical protein
MKSNFIVLKSNDPKYVFTPKWECKFVHSLIEDKNLLSDITEYLISEKQNIIEKYQPKLYPGDFQLSEFASRYMEYNLFDHAHDIECIQKLRPLIYESFKKIIKNSGDDTDYDPYVACWAMIMDPGETLQPHRHDNFEQSFLSGNMIISCETSHTVYEMPYQQDCYPVDNENGMMTIFESHLLHWTTPHNGKNPRVSIAFDFKENLDVCPPEYAHRFCKLNK